MCGLRREVKVTGKQNLISGCETMDTSHPGNTSDSLSHQRTLDLLKAYTDKLTQNPPGFPAMQEADESPPKYCHTTEDPQQGREEPHKSTPEAHGAMENFGKEDSAAKTDQDGNEEKDLCLDPSRIRKNSKIPGNDKEKPDTTEKVWKFHMTEKKDPDHQASTQKKDESKDSLVLDSGISKETLQELKNLLRESPVLRARVRNSGKSRNPSSHTHPLKSSDNLRSYMEMFHPRSRGGDQKALSGHKAGSGLAGKPPLLHSSAGLDEQPPENEDMDHSPGGQQTPLPNADAETIFEPTSEHSRDSSEKNIPLHLVSEIERIKEQMSRDNIRFVRFEAADLHGVSRSKCIPSRFFRVKAIHGVAMPRGYLELTLNPKDNEINHISARNFNCDIILSPELSTFRVLPWTEDTARVICDSFAVTGNPLLTSPRHIAKQQLGQLQDHGFALCSAFTYEFCIYGIAEIINSKTVTFPATTILNNQDQCFIQELIDGMYHAGANIESFSSSTGPGQMEISFHPEFGLSAADSAFTFHTGIKEVAKKYNYIASFFTENGFCNSGILSHSLWDISGQTNLFSSGSRTPEFTDIGKNWLAGLLVHSAALSCLMAPTTSCRKRYNMYHKDSKEMVTVKWLRNDNSCAFNVKSHGEKGTRIENRLGSAMANPYLVLSATIAAGLDGIRRGLSFQDATEEIQSTAQFKAATIPLKLEDALIALQEDECIREALGNTFVRYFIAMKQYEMENEEMDVERNNFLEYFI